METKRVDTYREYCKSRNKIKNMIKFFRKQKERKISINAKTNNKAFRKYTNSKTKIMSSIASLHSDPLDEDSMLVDKNSEKANILNQYFASVFIVEPTGNIPTIPSKQAEKQNDIVITRDIVKKLLSELNVNKSQGPDGLHTRFLKEASEELCSLLSLIFRESILTSTIPKQWKIARVSAIHKKGTKN